VVIVLGDINHAFFFFFFRVSVRLASYFLTRVFDGAGAF
jgi:hypothetical protein